MFSQKPNCSCCAGRLSEEPIPDYETIEMGRDGFNNLINSDNETVGIECQMCGKMFGHSFMDK